MNQNAGAHGHSKSGNAGLYDTPPISQTHGGQALPLRVV